MLALMFMLTSCDGAAILCEKPMKVDSIKLINDNTALYSISYRSKGNYLHHYKFVDKPNQFQLGDTIKFEK